jgi:CheY-like chemotaxis protein
MTNRATILVADDCLDDLELLKRAFQRAGVDNPLACVRDGHEAIDYLQQKANSAGSESAWPLLLLLDLNMPRCTGFAVLDWLRRQPNLRALPTIVISDSDERKDIEHSFRLGAHSYWVKPSRFEDLVVMVGKLKDILNRVAERVESESPALVAA